MDSALEAVLKRTNLRNHVIVYDETRRWPAAEREAAFGLGILRQIEDAEYVTCNACGDPHDTEVVLGMGAEPRVYCGEVGLMPIGPERLHQWEVDFEALARLLVAELKLAGGNQTVTPGRIWLLGRRQVADRTAEFFLVHGIAWSDTNELLRAAPRLQNSPAPIILCPDRLPQDPEWQQSGRALFRLTELMRLEDSRLVIEMEAFGDLYRQIADRVEEPIEPTPVGNRMRLIEDFCRDNNCRIKDICAWADVAREDLSRWKLGKTGALPDHSVKALRIEKLLRFGLKTRP